MWGSRLHLVAGSDLRKYVNCGLFKELKKLSIDQLNASLLCKA